MPMPTISTFRGIVIRMYYEDHSPPHFHALYQGQEAKLRIDPPSVLEGELPPRIMRSVLAWAEVHRSRLLENWTRAQGHERLFGILPSE
jgi:hypothetical protein